MDGSKVYSYQRENTKKSTLEMVAMQFVGEGGTKTNRREKYASYRLILHAIHPMYVSIGCAILYQDA